MSNTEYWIDHASWLQDQKDDLQARIAKAAENIREIRRDLAVSAATLPTTLTQQMIRNADSALAALQGKDDA